MAATAATDGGPRSPGARTTTGPPGSTAGGAAGSLAEVLEDLPHLAGEGLDLLQAPDRFRVVAIGVKEQQLGFREDSSQRVGEVVPELMQRGPAGGPHRSERSTPPPVWSPARAPRRRTPTPPPPPSAAAPAEAPPRHPLR